MCDRLSSVEGEGRWRCRGLHKPPLPSLPSEKLALLPIKQMKGSFLLCVKFSGPGARRWLTQQLAWIRPELIQKPVFLHLKLNGWFLGSVVTVVLGLNK